MFHVWRRNGLTNSALAHDDDDDSFGRGTARQIQLILSGFLALKMSPTEAKSGQ